MLDTNVISSCYLTPHGRVARSVDLWQQEVFELIISDAILSEYMRVLHYPRHRRVHGLTEAQPRDIEEAFREFTEFVYPQEAPAIVKDDPDDDHFLAAATAGLADCLVTGDPHLLKVGAYKGTPILSPSKFLIQFFPE